MSATEPAVLHAFEVDLAPAYSRVRHIRRITAAHLRLWDLPSLIEPATLVVSELVTNAIQHTDGASVSLRVQQRHADELRVEVADGTPKSAEPRVAGDDDESGRGLLIVAAVAREWGVSRGGEMTWCSLAIPRGARVNIAPNSEQRPATRRPSGSVAHQPHGSC
ncbi:ATP-binding protein [Streptomyces sp. NPDC002156]